METVASKKKQNIQEEDNGSDMIRGRSLNDYPEHIIMHILTFLPTVDAVRTSILSRKWQRQKLWRSLPSLDFQFPFNGMNNCTRITKFIDKILEIRSGFPIQKFCFRLNSFWCDQREHDICHQVDSKLDDWISYAISHKATKLHIDLPRFYRYNFNLGLLNNSCVRDVRLCGGKLCHSLPSLNLDSIRSVCLKHITLTDDMVVDLILWCTNLESLVLDSCRGMKRLRICSSTLKKLFVLENSEVSYLEICCPNLCSIRISDYELKMYYIKDSASLVEADVHFSDVFEKPSDVLIWWSKVLRVLTSVKRLTTQNYFFELLCEKDASFDGCVFENLNHLELVMGFGNCNLLGVAAFLSICPNITTLTLDLSFYNNEHVYDVRHNGWIPKELVDKPIEFNIPNLKILNLKNLRKGTVIEDLVELVKKHGAALENIFLLEQNGNRSSIPL